MLLQGCSERRELRFTAEYRPERVRWNSCFFQHSFSVPFLSTFDTFSGLFLSAFALGFSLNTSSVDERFN